MDLKKTIRFVNIVIRSRWFVLFASFFIISFSGATYIFGLYSPAIKSALNYDQKTLDTLGFFKDLGANVGIIAGLVNEVAPPWVVLAVGAAMNLGGYLMMWLSVTGRVATPKVWQMYLYISIGANSQTFTNTATLVTCVKNFPQSRGIVLGMLKGFAGLSGAIFTQIYHAIYGDDSTSLILLIGWLPCLVCLTLMCIVRLKKVITERNELNRFYSFLYIALSLAGFLMVVIIIENRVRFPAIAARLVATGAAVFLLVPLVVVVKAELERMKLQGWKSPDSMINMEIEAVKHDQAFLSSNQPDRPIVPETQRPQMEGSRTVNGDRDVDIETGVDQSRKFKHAQAGILQLKAVTTCKESQREIPDNDLTTEKRNTFLKLPKGPKRGEDFTILQALISLDLWLIFLGTACGLGSALTAVDNMGQIGNALGFSSVNVSTFVSLISIWNFLGRVVSGFSSEFLLKKYNLPRSALLCFVLAFSCVGHLLIAFAVPGCLYMASIILGFCFGAQWPVIFAMISELFGLKYYSTIFNIVSSASPLGIYLLSVRVAGFLYDKEARKQSANYSIEFEKARGLAPAPAPHHRNLVCKGAACFRPTFIIMALVSLLGVVIFGVLSIRTKEFYSRDLDSKYHQQAMETEGQEENGRS